VRVRGGAVDRGNWGGARWRARPAGLGVAGDGEGVAAGGVGLEELDARCTCRCHVRTSEDAQGCLKNYVSMTCWAHGTASKTMQEICFCLTKDIACSYEV
jgi:hypothetical protein